MTYIELDDKKHQEYSRSLNYDINGYKKKSLDSNNFFIHPNETLYFEFYIQLPIMSNRYIKFDKNKNYLSYVQVISDSTNAKKIISRTDLETIKSNGYKIYHGVLTSKNKIPIHFSECKK